MTNYPSGLTLRREELPLHAQVATAAPTRSRLVKEHSCSVPLPDETEGTCRYERLGPACHRFDYRYSDGSLLSRQYVMKPLGNAPADIEYAAKALASTAFREAMEHERKDYFARVTEPTDGSRRKDPKRYCLDAAKAKEFGGKYALCLPLGKGTGGKVAGCHDRLLRVSSVTATFDEIARMWRDRRNPETVVACCNRLDRRWEMLKLNPLHAEGHPRPAEVSDGI